MDFRRIARVVVRPAALLVIGAAVGMLGLAAFHTLTAPPAGPTVRTVERTRAALPSTTATRAAHIQPTRITISAIGVASALLTLGLNPDRTLQTPADFGKAGWYAAGGAPGDAGPPAVIVGHVDSYTGPAVFFRLHELTAGADIQVTGVDGKVRHFTVYRIAQYDKTTFPADEVYAATAAPELRVITCTGDFDSNTRSYLSNLVVYASMAA